jgi:hypothetical protein
MNMNVNEEGKYIRFSKKCSVTDETYVVTVETDDCIRWKEERMCIQDVFPMLDKEMREFLMTGTTPAEWEEMYGQCPL